MTGNRTPACLNCWQKLVPSRPGQLYLVPSLLFPTLEMIERGYQQVNGGWGGGQVNLSEKATEQSNLISRCLSTYHDMNVQVFSKGKHYDALSSNGTHIL